MMGEMHAAIATRVRTILPTQINLLTIAIL